MKSFIYLLTAILPLISAAAIPLDISEDDDSIVPDQYIITLKKNADAPTISGHLDWVEDIQRRSLEARGPGDGKKGKRPGKGKKYGGVEKVWKGGLFKGYTGEFPQETIDDIAESDDVLAVEPVRKIEITRNTQNNAPWGLGSISHRTPHWDKYWYSVTAGAGTFAYVIDTGCYTDHVEFQGRASLGYNAVTGTDFVDLQGHGTHVAGTIASQAYGVAKKAKIISVRVFDQGGSTTAVVLDGLVWAVNNITNTPGRANKSVINMSVGGGYSAALNNAVNSAFLDKNIITVVAAGNSGEDAKSTSPASAMYGITVGAVDYDNNRPDFSNYGKAVDVFAPGVDVQSTFIRSNTDSANLSGTSMATPHVAGLVCYLMGLGDKTLNSAAAIVQRIQDLATTDVVGNPGTDSVNRLAYNGVS